MPNRTARALLLLASATSLAACSWIKSTIGEPVAPLHMLTPYFDDDFRFWKGTGNATIVGEASYKLDDGRVVTCAGQTVTLLPATQYNMELAQDLGSGSGYPFDYSKKAHVYNRETACDPTGHFRFEQVPAGVKWIVLTRIAWQEASAASMVASVVPMMSEDVNNTGGYIYQDVMASEGSNKIVLSNPDFVRDN